ncbi:MAG: hypothetical protein ABJC13_15000 [Acidobacteriota bacterium]
MTAKACISSASRISTSIKELGVSAERLNSVSDELAKAIRPIDAALKKLNLGVAAWYQYARSSNSEDSEYWSRHIGYAKVGHKWGLALSMASGPEGPEGPEEEEWLFSDAPRWMRVEAVDHIPDLLEHLVERANEVAESLQKQTDHAREFAGLISALTATSEGKG